MDFVNLMQSLTLNENTITTEPILKPVTVKINQVDTEILYGDFVDRTVLIITQFEKFGSIFKISKDYLTGIDNLPGDSEAIYTIQCIFGQEDDLQITAARFLAEQLFVNDKQLILFMCLKDYSPTVLKAIVQVILNEKKSKEQNKIFTN